MTDRAEKRRWIAWIAVACIGLGGVAGGAYWWSRPKPEPLPEPEPTFPLPGYSKSQYLNTAPGTAYIGTAACAECHRSNHQSYLRTAHSRSLSDVDPSAEPADGGFEHKATGRSYRVYRKDNQMRHLETMQGEDGKEIGRVDLPVRYLVGSGSFSRTYLVEVDGFLHESPITYYAAAKKWALSPGYDGPWNFGFERPIKLDCIFCHAGRVEVSAESVHRMTFAEKAIGCENCHGPGALHEKRQRSQKSIAGDDDLTIVNPAKLPRALQEDVCAVCHLNGHAFVHLRGRECTDFRPGMPLSDYRIHYQFEGRDEQMTVVGHVEQLRQSVCYQKSTMTCVTCHDPHRRPKDAVAFYRQKCLECHAESAPAKDKTACRLDPDERRKKDPVDNCTVCHMPRGGTDIPHIAFTHHRIGRHGPSKPPPSPQRVPTLVPMENVKHLAPIDQQRNLGLAYLAASKGRAYPEFRGAFHQKGIELLHVVHAQGLRDPMTAKALAEEYFQTDPVRAAPFAEEILATKNAPLDARGSALMTLGFGAMRQRDVPTAIARLQEMAKIYRNPDVPFYLGVCYLEQKQPDKAARALEEAVAMRPFRAAPHRALAEAYRQTGREDLAREHLNKAMTLKLAGQE